jgi:hypothetical protein
MRAEAYGDDVSDLFERYHGTPDQSFGIWLKDGETSYYEFSLKRQVFVRKVAARRFKLPFERLSLIVRQRLYGSLIRPL